MSSKARLKELQHDLDGLLPSSDTAPDASRGAGSRRAGSRSAGSTGQRHRGRSAEAPTQIPPRGWKDVAWRSWEEISAENLFLISGGVTYAILLALFPGLAALVALYGLAFDARQIEQQVDALSGVLPEQTRELLSGQLHSLVQSSQGALGFAAIAGILIAIWSASRGMSGLITAINIAYIEKESRSFIRLNLMAIGLTLGLLVGGIIAIALVAVLPAAVQLLDLGGVVPLRAEPGRAAMAMGVAGGGHGDRAVDRGLGRLQRLRREFQQLRQDLWLAGRRGRAADLALSLRLHRAAGRGDQRAGGAADPQGFDGRRAAADGHPQRPCRRHAGRLAMSGSR